LKLTKPKFAETFGNIVTRAGHIWRRWAGVVYHRMAERRRKVALGDAACL
jgi:hypothetical protein